jgi:hypothetical protein
LKPDLAVFQGYCPVYPLFNGRLVTDEKRNGISALSVMVDSPHGQNYFPRTLRPGLQAT